MILAKTRFDSDNFTYGNVVFEVMSKDGILIKRHVQKIDSFVENYWRKVYGTQVVTSQTLTRFNGDTSSLSATQSFGFNTSGGENYMGIVVGMGDTPVSLDDFALDNLTEHGTSTNQLEYGSQVLTRSSDTLFIIARSFINNSGAAININEVGLAAHTSGTATTNPFLIVRDTLSASFEVPDEAVLNVSYQFEITNVNRNWIQYITGWFQFTVSIQQLIGSSNLSGLAGHILPNTSFYRNGPMLLSSSTNTASITFSTTSGLYTASSIFMANVGEASDIDINVAGGTVHYSIERIFTNVSGSSQLVRSVALLASSSTSGTTASSSTDAKAGRILPSERNIPNGESLFVKWDFEYSL